MNSMTNNNVYKFHTSLIRRIFIGASIFAFGPVASGCLYAIYPEFVAHIPNIVIGVLLFLFIMAVMFGTFLLTSIPVEVSVTNQGIECSHHESIIWHDIQSFKLSMGHKDCPMLVLKCRTGRKIRYMFNPFYEDEESETYRAFVYDVLAHIDEVNRQADLMAQNTTADSMLKPAQHIKEINMAAVYGPLMIILGLMVLVLFFFNPARAMALLAILGVVWVSFWGLKNFHNNESQLDKKNSRSFPSDKRNKKT